MFNFGAGILSPYQIFLKLHWDFIQNWRGENDALRLPQRKDLCGMGWLRLVGSLNLKVSFAECHVFNRALLQKRPIILRSLLIVVTPYTTKSPMFFLVVFFTTCTFCNFRDLCGIL